MKNILKEIEEHCGEKLECSRRMRFLIESRFKRLQENHNKLKANISNVMNGFDTYNPGEYTTRRLPKQ